jgi:hypothetical protein
MDRPKSKPVRPDHPEEPQSQGQPTAVSNIETLLPTANANQLMDLIAQGNDPSDLDGLIKHAA